MKNVKYSELDLILVLKSYNPIFKISKYLGKHTVNRFFSETLCPPELQVPDPNLVSPTLSLFCFDHEAKPLPQQKAPSPRCWHLVSRAPGPRWPQMVWTGVSGDLTSAKETLSRAPALATGTQHTWPRHVLGRNYQDLAWPGPCVLWSSVSRSDHNKGHIRHKHSKVDTKCTPLSFSLSHKARRATRR